jgi:predicted metal-dependent hydrolase
VFEAAWKSIPGPERELWRGLAQIAVGLTHARRGNAAGAMTLLRRGAAQVAGFAGTSGEVDADFVAGQAASLALRIEQDGLTEIPEADLRLRLRPGG